LCYGYYKLTQLGYHYKYFNGYPYSGPLHWFVIKYFTSKAARKSSFVSWSFLFASLKVKKLMAVKEINQY